MKPKQMLSKTPCKRCFFLQGVFDMKVRSMAAANGRKGRYFGGAAALEKERAAQNFCEETMVERRLAFGI